MSWEQYADLGTRLGNVAYSNYKRTGRITGNADPRSDSRYSVIARATNMARNYKRNVARIGLKSNARVVRQATRAMSKRILAKPVFKAAGPRRRKIGRAFSAGKVAAKRKVRSIKNRMYNGVSRTEEIGQLLTTSEVQYVGHITHPQSRVLRLMWSAVIKVLLQKVGFIFETLDVALPTLVTDSLVIVYQPGTNIAAAQIVLTVAAGSSVVSIVEQIMGSLFYSGSFINQQDFSIVSLQYVCTVYNSNANTASLNIGALNLRTSIKSYLKMQNRSFTVATNNEADDLDNVPLFGKIYSGAGTGAKLKTIPGVAAKTLFGSVDNGLITANAGTLNQMAEPPAPFMFNEVTKYGSMSLEPSMIKTSSLFHNSYEKFNELHSKIMQYNTSTNFVKRKLGKFQFMALEKVLDATNVVNSINIAIEHNWTCTIQAYPAQAYTTSTYFNKTYL